MLKKALEQMIDDRNEKISIIPEKIKDIEEELKRVEKEIRNCVNFIRDGHASMSVAEALEKADNRF